MTALPRTSPRQPGDFVIGYGVPAEGQTSGKSCAGVGTEPSCELCPLSPNYWRLSYGGKPVSDREVSGGADAC